MYRSLEEICEAAEGSSFYEAVLADDCKERGIKEVESKAQMRAMYEAMKQAEIGSASAMAAGAVTWLRGGAGGSAMHQKKCDRRGQCAYGIRYGDGGDLKPDPTGRSDRRDAEYRKEHAFLSERDRGGWTGGDTNRHADQRETAEFYVRKRGQMMGKEAKTNAMRLLERNKIPYEVLNYECDEFIDGLHTAEATGAPVEQSFKTLVMQGKSGQFYVDVVPIADEVDLKAAAKAVGEKSVEMIHVKDITKITGYVRGGCSPLGMKKAFHTIVHQSAAQYDKIYISGGRIGTSIALSPEDLMKVIDGAYADIIQ